MKNNNKGKGINPVVAAVAAGAVVATGVVGAILMNDKDNQKKVKDAMNDVKGKVVEQKDKLEGKAQEIKGKVEDKAGQVGAKVEKVMDAVKEPMANGKK